MRDTTDIRALIVLMLCQALAMTCTALVVTTTALAGRMLASDPALATFPLAIQFLSLMVATRPAAAFMGRYGRRNGFRIGAISGSLAGILASYAILIGSFMLFCLGAALTGIFLAHAMHYRFAAADTAPPAFQSQAISLVVAGGVFAAVAGPQLANLAKDLFAPIPFAGAYAVLGGLCALQFLVLQFNTLPDAGTGPPAAADPAEAVTATGRGQLIAAVACGMVGYGSMNLVMAVTPPAIADCGFGFGAAAFVIQWHVFAMYAPAFATGYLIRRLGLSAVLLTGVAAMLAAVAVNLAGLTLGHFSVGLVLLGVGWSFLFVGATTWLTRVPVSATAAQLQGLNDLWVFGTVAATSLGSGWLFDALGWRAVNLAIVPGLLLVALLVLRQESRPAVRKPVS